MVNRPKRLISRKTDSGLAAKVMWALAGIKGLELLTLGFFKVTRGYIKKAGPKHCLCI